MAGSYNHIVGPGGKLISNKDFTIMIENLGDAYELTEEMYGMIWWMANALQNTRISSSDDRNYSELTEAEIVELARKNYQRGVAESPGIAD